MSRHHRIRLVSLTLLIAAGVQGSSEHELADLERLQREIALVRQFTQELQLEYSEATRLRFRYEAVIEQLANLEQGISEHIRYAHQAPRWERFHD